MGQFDHRGIRGLTSGGEWLTGMRYQLRFRRYSLPFLKPVRTAHGLWAERTGVVVQLTDETGKIGYGEAAPIPWFGTGTVEEAEQILGGLGAFVEEEQFAAIPQSAPTVRFALQTALADTPPLAREHLQVAALLPAGRSVLSVLDERLEAGFRVFKWKVGVGDAADERVLLDDVLARLPTGARLRLDANGAWNRRQAEAWLNCTAERPIEFIEQPVSGEGQAGTDLLLGLANDFPTVLALDESLVGLADIQRWLGLGWPGIYVIKPCLLADPSEALATLARAKADVVFSSALETAVGARAALLQAFAWRGEHRALGFGVWPLFANAAFNGPSLAPFIRSSDLARLDAGSVWAALD